MTWKNFLPVTAGLLFASLVGCQSPLSSLIRGQNPGPQDAPYGNVVPASAGHGAIVYGDGAQEIYGCPDGNCQQERGRWDHQWSYVPPQGLSYPPANQPASVVQYPYYTLKGPDDFFKQ